MAWTLWNLFLATLPIPFSVAVARRLREGSGSAPRRVTTVAMAVAGLLLLPNAPYLLTEIRHFVLDAPFRDLTARAAHDPAALRLSALWGALFVAYGAVGLAAYVVAVRPVERALVARGVSRLAVRALLTPTVALGVWLGLVPRFNSWDALIDPLRVLGTSVYAVTHVPTATSILGFALALGALHAAGDLVVDALERRLRPAASPLPTTR
jgi:uncharacterized membrane protein